MPDRDIYAYVTDKIVAALERGVVPWHRPWRTGHPVNLATGREYHGINALLLPLEGRSTRYWLTYKQAEKLGGHVRRGEKSTKVVFFDRYIKQVEDDDGELKPEVRWVLRYWSVFNLDQIDGIDAPDDEGASNEELPAPEAIVAEYPDCPTINNGPLAGYAPRRDEVIVPPLADFENSETYYATLFHELVHSTGHESRLDRNGDLAEALRFGSKTYAKEELVAEIGAAFLVEEAGIGADVHYDQSAAYIQSWLKALNNDKRLIVTAASRAAKAADYIRGRSGSVESSPAESESASVGDSGAKFVGVTV